MACFLHRQAAFAAASSAQELSCTFIMFACIQVGTDNACRCKVLGLTLDFIIGLVSACICWPLGALSNCCCLERR